MYLASFLKFSPVLLTRLRKGTSLMGDRPRPCSFLDFPSLLQQSFQVFDGRCTSSGGAGQVLGAGQRKQVRPCLACPRPRLCAVSLLAPGGGFWPAMAALLL